MGLFDFIGDIISVPFEVVKLAGKTIEVIGEVTDCEFLEEAGRTIQDNSDIISK